MYAIKLYCGHDGSGGSASMLLLCRCPVIVLAGTPIVHDFIELLQVYFETGHHHFLLHPSQFIVH
jgi:hypothetical protein